MNREEFLKLPFFKQEGFTLKKCIVCGSDFWTLDPEKEVCGDQPCTDYQFIGNSVGLRISTSKEIRERFLDFFERNGHKRISRYPVVARWREDVYFVGASIYDFQPWVTEGLVEPPANPLVISQPSIRLTDVDNVGKTGRHLTGFEMMAHHAFNMLGKTLYWANETVEYSYKLLTEEFKIPGEEISYKFDWWSGGGNAGEDYEVLVRGLEVATLVFMHYRVSEQGVVKELGNRIVDTGYGLERFLWLFSGAPTIYDAAFPNIVETLRREAGVEKIDQRIAVEIFKKSGKLDFKKPERALATLSEIALNLNMSKDELEGILVPYTSLYALADHSRTLVWMLGDGTVPSNVGSGYLARLLIRRALRHLWKLELELPLSEIILMQLSEGERDFPEYVDLKDEIVDIIDYEEKRYKETLRHGRKVVERMLRELAPKGAAEVSREKLVELYESHGLPPDLVAEEAAKFGVHVSVPPDFFSSLASRHEVASRKPVEIEEKMRAFAEGLPSTVKLYYVNPKMLEFEAKVLKSDGNFMVLDQTNFYPEGGGQPCDEGVIEWKGGRCRVLKVENIGGVVVHVCDGAIPPPGEIVKGRVNGERREALMKSHTATHIVLGSARRVLGKHVWQAGAQKGVEQSRLDITHHKKISQDEIRLIEKLANTVVMSNRSVRIYNMDRTTAEMKYGFTIYQGGVVPETTLRLVEIEGWDVEACGGLHCSSTGEVGLIKIVKVERLQDGISRLVFKVGNSALEYIWRLEDDFNLLAEKLQTSTEKVVEKAEQLASEVEELKKELSKAKARLLISQAQVLASLAEEVAGVKLVARVVDGYPVKDLALEVSRILQSAVIGLVDKDSGEYAIKVGGDLVRKGIDARGLNEKVLKVTGGKGGGASDLVTGKVENAEAFVTALKNALLK